MLTLNENFVLAMTPKTKQAGWIVSIIVGFDDDELPIQYQFNSYDQNVHGVMMGLDTIEPIGEGQELDPVTRDVKTGAYALVLADKTDTLSGIDGRVRLLSNATMLVGKRVDIDLGELDLDLDDYEPLARRLVIEEVLPEAGKITIRCADLYSWGLDREVDAFFVADHPIAVARAALTAVGPAEIVDSTTLNELLYTDTSHFVISGHYMSPSPDAMPYIDLIPEGRFYIAQNVGGDPTTNYLLEESWLTKEEGDLRGIKIREKVNLALGVINAGLVPAEPGVFEYRSVDLDATPVMHFTSAEVGTNFQQTKTYEDIANQCEIFGRAADGQTLSMALLTDHDAALIAGYPLQTGSTERRYVKKDFPESGSHPMLGAVTLTSRFWGFAGYAPDGRGFLTDSALDVGETTIRLELPQYRGFCGTLTKNTDGTWRTDGVQLPEHEISADRPVFLLLTDHNGRTELVRCTTAVTLSEGFATVTLPSGSTRDFHIYADYLIERDYDDQIGPGGYDWTQAQAENTLRVYDVTIARWRAEQLVLRQRLGLPQVTLGVPVARHAVQISDCVSFDDNLYLAYPVSGATAGATWEVIGKRPEGKASIQLKLALLRNGDAGEPPDITAEPNRAPYPRNINGTIVYSFTTGDVSGTSTSGSGLSVVGLSIPATWGDTLFRGATTWEVLPAGTAGYLFSTGGPGADPSYVSRASVAALATLQTAYTAGAAVNVTGATPVSLSVASGGTGLSVTVGSGTPTAGVSVASGFTNGIISGSPVRVNSTLRVTGAATFDGAMTLGDSPADLISILGDVNYQLTFRDTAIVTNNPGYDFYIQPGNFTNPTASNGAALGLQGGQAGTTYRGGDIWIDGGTAYGTGTGGNAYISGGNGNAGASRGSVWIGSTGIASGTVSTAVVNILRDETDPTSLHGALHSYASTNHFASAVTCDTTLAVTGISTFTGEVRVVSQVRLAQRVGDPASVSNTGFVYAKDVSGTAHLFYEDDTATVHQITPLPAGGGTATLQSAYTAGSSVTVVSGTPVRLTRSDTNTTAMLHVDQDNAGGDAAINFTVDTTSWMFGIDGSQANDPLKFSRSTALGTTDIMALESTGVVVGALGAAGDSLLHVWGSTAGAITALAGTVATFESNLLTYIQLLSPSSSGSGSGINFGDPTNTNQGGGIFWYPDEATLTFSAGGSGAAVYHIGASLLGDFGLSIGNSARPVVPDCLVHAVTADQSVVAPTGTIIAIEGSTAYYGIFGTIGGLVFGDTADPTQALFVYSHTTNAFSLASADQVLQRWTQDTAEEAPGYIDLLPNDARAGELRLRVYEEVLTLSSGTIVQGAAGAIPSGALVVGGNWRVTTSITGSTSIDIGLENAQDAAGGSSLFAAARTALTAGTVGTGANRGFCRYPNGLDASGVAIAGAFALAPGGFLCNAADRLQVASNSGTFTAGAVRIRVYYYMFADLTG